MPDEEVALGVPRYYTHDDRLGQLTALADACRRTGPLLIENGYREVGQMCIELADAAEAMAVSGFAEGDLRPLTHAALRFPDWLHPKAADYNARREPWQDAVAEMVPRIRQAQLELRALATYDKL
jgi:hypothetical protein